MFDRFRKLLADGLPRSLFTRIREDRQRPEATGRLYILDVDFPLDENRAAELSRTLDVYRERYGLDFFLMEPGFRLRRFDDI